MRDELIRVLCCPVCGAPMRRDGGSLFCAGETKKHCFDLAKSGYVNLLPPGRAGNAKTGDDGEMIRARCAFLSLGLYDGISDGVAAAAAKYLSRRERYTLIDAGCGEGYHTCRIASAVGRLTGAPTLALGFDASKHGAEAGARRARTAGLETDGVSVGFAAGNLFRLPVRDGSADAVFSLFAPIAGAENARVLREDGILVVAASGRRHLWELREVLYDEPRESGGEIRTPDGFVPVGEENVSYRARVPDTASLENLYRMTPFAFRTPREGLERLRATPSLEVTVDVLVRVFRKAETAGETI